MQEFDLYGDIARRTGGNIYIGVVGPVRTGKSTFLSRFMQEMVLPNMTDGTKRQEALDEMPQSGSGKTITTTEPKFLPSEATEVDFGEAGKAQVRMIDCVGYMVEGAIGEKEEDRDRLVQTVWQEEPMPFSLAAEIGTKKVISDHSTIAVLITTDGSFTDIPRTRYAEAEERVEKELAAAGKPHVIVLNSADAESAEVKRLRASLEEKYGVPVLAMNVLTAGKEEFSALLERMLYEFPVTKLHFDLPDWLRTLPADDPVISRILKKLGETAKKVSKMRDYVLFEAAFDPEDKVENPVATEVVPANGSVTFSIAAKEGVFFDILSGSCGEDIRGEYDLMRYCKELTTAKKEYGKLKEALIEAEETGYGVVVPRAEDMKLDEPVSVRRNGGYGVKIRATAPSLHIMRVDVSTEISPIVGSEQQSREMAEFLKTSYETDPSSVWETDLLGKSLRSMVSDGLEGKISSMPPETRNKMRKTVTRIVNEGRGGVFCILL